MRPCLLALLGILASSTSWAQPCSYSKTERPPLVSDTLRARLQRTVECKGESKGSLKIRFYRRENGKRVLAKEKEIKVKPRKQRVNKIRIWDSINATDYCEQKNRKTPVGRLIGVGTKQRRMLNSELEVGIEGEGDLESLSWSSKISVLCPKCPVKKSGSFRIKQGRGLAGRLVQNRPSKLAAQISNSWFQCARHESWIDFRLFDDRDGKPANAIRPAYVMKDLQKRFVRAGDKQEISALLSFEKVCQAVGKGHHRLMWEVLGYGELTRMTSGGRSWLNVSCP